MIAIDVEDSLKVPPHQWPDMPWFQEALTSPYNSGVNTRGKTVGSTRSLFLAAHESSEQARLSIAQQPNKVQNKPQKGSSASPSQHQRKLLEGEGYLIWYLILAGNALAHMELNTFDKLTGDRQFRAQDIERSLGTLLAQDIRLIRAFPLSMQPDAKATYLQDLVGKWLAKTRLQVLGPAGVSSLPTPIPSLAACQPRRRDRLALGYVQPSQLQLRIRRPRQARHILFQTCLPVIRPALPVRL